MKNILLYLLLLLGIAPQLAWAQGRTVRGTVTDAQGPVPGVSVYEKDLTANGTTTDLEGKYTLSLRGQSGVLVYRSVNYKLTEIQVGNRSTVNVKMESGEQSLDEVTVVGYGEQKKVTQTGSVSQVSGREIRENPSASLQNALVGRLPGFYSQQTSGRPGADGANFYIRGISSFNGNNQPLIIVDDVQYSYDQFQRLDPNEIESLSILKDAATTAIYGVRGANGVVVVTTRRGKEGPTQVTGRVEVGFTQPTKITKYLDAYNSASLYNQALVNDGGRPRFTGKDLQLFKDGSDPYDHPNVDWRKELFRNWSQQYRGNIDMSGGSPRAKYFVSVGYLYQNGMLKDFSAGSGVNNNYYQQRYNYRSNLDLNVTKGLDVTMNLYGNFATVNQPNVASPNGVNAPYGDIFYDYSSFYTLSPFSYPIYNPDGSYGYSKFARDANSPYNVNNVVGRLTNDGYYRTFENNINGVVSAKFDFGQYAKPLKGLNITGRVAYTSNYSYGRSETRTTFPSYIYTDSTKTYEVRDPNVYRVQRYSLGYGGGSTSRVVTLQAIVNYARSFGKHNVSGLVLYNRNSNTGASGNAIYNFIPSNFLGYSARFDYNYDERYLFQINAGYNGSDRFSSQNRYGLFPAVSAGWNIGNEAFFRRALPFIDYLKFRGSYGLVGNDALGSGFSYYYVQNYNTNSNSTTGGYVFNTGTNSNPQPGISEGTLANNDVTWEKEKKLDVAVEFRLFKDRLSGSVDYFNNNRYDILTRRPSVTGIFGQTLPAANIGRTNNRGIEVELGWQSPRSRNFSWFVKGNVSRAQSKVLFWDEPLSQYDYQNFTGHSVNSLAGYLANPSSSLYRIYQLDNIKFYTAESIADPSVPKPSSTVNPGDLRYKDLNGDGKIDAFDTFVPEKNNIPTITYGLNLGARYKNFSVSILLQGSADFYVSAYSEAIRAFTSNLQPIHQQAWTPELGENAQYPRLTLLSGISDPTSNMSTFWQLPGDFVRLKNVQLNYELPTDLLRKVGIPSARIYASGTNLLTWTKASSLYQFDPELALNSRSVIYPPQRLVNCGMSVTF
jgi:TonB-linked SusC/RagA family outer membrane protein